MIRFRVGLWLLLLVGLFVIAQPVAGQEAITVKDQKVSYTFSKEIVFQIELTSSSPVEEITLFYEFKHGDAINRRSPEFTPGTHVTATFKERLQRGEIPPATEISYYWRIRTASGEALQTDPQTFLYMDDRFPFEQLSEGKITVYWYGADRRFGQRVLDSAVRALKRLERTIGTELKDPVRLIIYQTKKDMLEALPRRGVTFDERITTLGIVVAPDTILILGQQPDLDATIAHELTHVVVGLATDNPYGDIPAWLNEGLAMYNEYEGTLRGANRSALEQAIRENRLHSVRSLTAPTGNPSEVNLWYGEVFSVVDFLIRTYGPEKMAQLLEVFKKGATYDDALMQVYGFDQDGLDALWRQSLGLPPREAPASTPQPAPIAQPTVSPVEPVSPPEMPVSQAAPPPRAWLYLLLVGLCCLFLFGLLLLLGIVVVWVLTRRPPRSQPPGPDSAGHNRA